jgi:hypothetical protein
MATGSYPDFSPEFDGESPQHDGISWRSASNDTQSVSSQDHDLLGTVSADEHTPSQATSSEKQPSKTLETAKSSVENFDKDPLHCGALHCKNKKGYTKVSALIQHWNSKGGEGCRNQVRGKLDEYRERNECLAHICICQTNDCQMICSNEKGLKMHVVRSHTVASNSDNTSETDSSQSHQKRKFDDGEESHSEAENSQCLKEKTDYTKRQKRGKVVNEAPASPQMKKREREHDMEDFAEQQEPQNKKSQSAACAAGHTHCDATNTVCDSIDNTDTTDTIIGEQIVDDEASQSHTPHIDNSSLEAYPTCTMDGCFCGTLRTDINTKQLPARLKFRCPFCPHTAADGHSFNSEAKDQGRRPASLLSHIKSAHSRQLAMEATTNKWFRMLTRTASCKHCSQPFHYENDVHKNHEARCRGLQYDGLNAHFLGQIINWNPSQETLRAIEQQISPELIFSNTPTANLKYTKKNVRETISRLLMRIIEIFDLDNAVNTSEPRIRLFFLANKLIRTVNQQVDSKVHTGKPTRIVSNTDLARKITWLVEGKWLKIREYIESAAKTPRPPMVDTEHTKAKRIKYSIRNGNMSKAMSALDSNTQVHQIQCDDVPKVKQVLKLDDTPTAKLIDRVGETDVDPKNTVYEDIAFEQAEVAEQLRRLNRASSGGIDKITATDLQYMPLAVVKRITELIANNRCRSACLKYLAGGRLTALKKAGSSKLRPIVPQSLWVRLTAKMMINRLRQEITSALGPRQFAVNSKSGTTNLLCHLQVLQERDPGLVIMTADVKNGYGCVQLSALREQIMTHQQLRPLLGYIDAIYGSKPVVEMQVGDKTQRHHLVDGLIQGDPLAPTLFSLLMREAVDKANEVLQSDPDTATASIGFVGSYIDDLVIAARPEKLPDVMRVLKQEVAKWGGEFRLDKTQLYSRTAELISHDVMTELTSIVAHAKDCTHTIKHAYDTHTNVALQGITILGVPIGTDAFRKSVIRQKGDMNLFQHENLESFARLPSQEQFLLFNYCITRRAFFFTQCELKTEEFTNTFKESFDDKLYHDADALLPAFILGIEKDDEESRAKAIRRATLHGDHGGLGLTTAVQSLQYASIVIWQRYLTSDLAVYTKDKDYLKIQWRAESPDSIIAQGLQAALSRFDDATTSKLPLDGNDIKNIPKRLCDLLNEDIAISNKNFSKAMAVVAEKEFLEEEQNVDKLYRHRCNKTKNELNALTSIPYTTLLTMPDSHFRQSLRRYMLLPHSQASVVKLCTACKKDVVFDDYHMLHCSREIARHDWHNTVQHRVGLALKAANLRVVKEPRGLAYSDGSQRGPDLVARGFDLAVTRSKFVAERLDVTVTSAESMMRTCNANRQKILNETAYAAKAAELKKLHQSGYADAAAQLNEGFRGIAIEYTGVLGPNFQSLLNQVSRMYEMGETFDAFDSIADFTPTMWNPSSKKRYWTSVIIMGNMIARESYANYACRLNCIEQSSDFRDASSIPKVSGKYNSRKRKSGSATSGREKRQTTQPVVSAGNVTETHADSSVCADSVLSGSAQSTREESTKSRGGKRPAPVSEASASKSRRRHSGKQD